MKSLLQVLMRKKTPEIDLPIYLKKKAKMKDEEDLHLNIFEP